MFSFKINMFFSCSAEMVKELDKILIKIEDKGMITLSWVRIRSEDLWPVCHEYVHYESTQFCSLEITKHCLQVDESHGSHVFFTKCLCKHSEDRRFFWSVVSHPTAGIQIPSSQAEKARKPTAIPALRWNEPCPAELLRGKTPWRLQLLWKHPKRQNGRLVEGR